MLVLYSASLSDHSLVTAPSGKQAAASVKTEDAAAAAASETVVILADADLLELPLEAITSLRADVIDSISRDISLQLLYHRLTTTPPGECRPQHCFILYYLFPKFARFGLRSYKNTRCDFGFVGIYFALIVYRATASTWCASLCPSFP